MIAEPLIPIVISGSALVQCEPVAFELIVVMMTGLRAWKFEIRPALLGAGLALLAICSSCATRGNVEMLEAQLRSQETAIRHYEESVSQLQEELKVAQRETDMLRGNMAGQSSLVAYEEVTSSVARANELVFNTFLTAALDHDQAVGDERLHAVFYPADARGEVIKLTGEVEVEAIDPSRPDGDRLLGHWKYTPEQSRHLWHSGFLSSGFQVAETWHRAPQGNKVVLIARLSTLDGRKFEATHTIAVDPEGRVTAAAGTAVIKKVSAKSPVDIPAETRLVPDPEPWEHASKPRESVPLRATAAGDAVFGPEIPRSTATPAAFPDGVQTSDRWTETEIPALR